MLKREASPHLNEMEELRCRNTRSSRRCRCADFPHWKRALLKKLTSKRDNWQAIGIDLEMESKQVLRFCLQYYKRRREKDCLTSTRWRSFAAETPQVVTKV